MLKKNFSTNKMRNQSTVITQTLTLACMLFLSTMLNLELNSFDSYRQLKDVDLYIYGNNLNIEIIDTILKSNAEGVENFALTT